MLLTTLPLIILAATAGGFLGWFPVLCILTGLVMFGIAAFMRTDPVPSWNKFVALGLFFCTLGLLIQMAGGLF